MRVIVTDHAMEQMRVRGFGKWVDAPAKEISEAVAGAVVMGRTRKVRDMGTAQLFTVEIGRAHV